MLAVVHNVTAATRMVDILTVLEGDLRLQVVFTVPGSSPFSHGTSDWLTSIGAIVVPWWQAKQLDVDLVISASHGGELHALKAPIAIFPHGIGYNKYLDEPTSRRADEPTSRRAVFGLSAPWLMHDGRVIPDALVLSHVEQFGRLRVACPEAVEVAVVAGDPCLDRLAASVHLRGAYRAAFGVVPGQRLVVVNSTWGPNSLFGTDPQVIQRLLGELPADEYRVVAALHPNIWHGHSPWQLRSGWLAEGCRCGLVLAPPFETWRAALVGADVVIGDHSSVTFYAAALGRPVLLAAAHLDGMDPASAVARFCAAAPRLRVDRGLAGQIEAVIADSGADRYAAATADATSAPGEAAARIRSTLYGLLGVPEPVVPAVTAVVAIPSQVTPQPVTAWLVAAETNAATNAATVAETDADGPRSRVRRYPAALRLADPPAGDTLLLVDLTHRDPSLLGLADVIVGSTVDAQTDPDTWAGQVLSARPGCLVAAVTWPDGSCRVYQHTATPVDLTPVPGQRTADPMLAVSGWYGWLASGGSTVAELTVTAGPITIRLRVTTSRAVQTDDPAER